MGLTGFRFGLVLYAVFVPGFWLSYRPVSLGFTDPFGWRLALAGVALTVLAATYVSAWVRSRLVELFVGLVWAMTAWYVPLLVVNGLHHEYVIGMLLIVTASAFAIAVMGEWQKRARRVLWYIGFVSAVMLTVSALAPAPQVELMQFVVYVGFVLAMAYHCVRVTTSAEGRLARSEASARTSDERFRRVFDNVRDVLFEIDERGRWTLLSPAWTELTGYAVERSLGCHFFEAVLDDDKEATYRRAEALFQQEQEVYDEVIRIRTARGTVRWVEVRSRLTYDCEGALTGAAGTLTDVTDSVRIQAEQQARQRAEELLHVKTSFLNNMSHELRTPLTSILGFAEVLADQVEGEQAEFAGLIHTSASRLLGTVNSVLDLAQLEGRGLRLDPQRLDLAAEAVETAQILRPLAEQKGIALDVEVPEGGVTAVMDLHAFHRIMTNLVGNAIKFTDSGGVCIGISATAESLRVAVEDTGAGIPEAALPTLFEPFRQASEGLAREHEGNGLGLTITRQLVDLMGGTVTAESEVGVGTRFVVELPRWSGTSASPEDVLGSPVAPSSTAERGADQRATLVA